MCITVCAAQAKENKTSLIVCFNKEISARVCTQSSLKNTFQSRNHTGLSAHKLIKRSQSENRHRLVSACKDRRRKEGEEKQWKHWLCCRKGSNVTDTRLSWLFTVRSLQMKIYEAVSAGFQSCLITREMITRNHFMALTHGICTKSLMGINSGILINLSTKSSECFVCRTHL